MAKIQINENIIKYMVKKCLNEIFLKEGQRMTEYFIVEKMLDNPIGVFPSALNPSSGDGQQNNACIEWLLAKTAPS